jgi:hypothetical protein
LTAAAASLTIFGELMQVLHIVPRQSQILQVSYRHGSCQMRLGSEKPQADNHIVLQCLVRCRFVPESDCKASSTCKLLPIHTASLANFQIEIRFSGKHGDGSCVTGSAESQIGIIYDLFRVKGISEPVLLRVSFFSISVTKL